MVVTSPSFVTGDPYDVSTSTQTLTFEQIFDNALAGEYTVTLDYTVTQDSPLPPFTASTTITITVLKNCAAQIISAPAILDKLYTVPQYIEPPVPEPLEPLPPPALRRQLGGTSILNVAEFQNDMPDRCPLEYTLETSPDAFFIKLLPPRDLFWATADYTHVGQYVVTVRGTGPMAVMTTTSFTLTIELECVDAVLKITSAPLVLAGSTHLMYLPAPMEPIVFRVVTS